MRHKLSPVPVYIQVVEEEPLTEAAAWSSGRLLWCSLDTVYKKYFRPAKVKNMNNL